MIDILSIPFMQRALAAGLLVGLLAGYYGVFVVQRQLSFLGAGLAHAAFGGVALGLLLQINPVMTAVPFTVLVATGINRVRSRTQLGGDTSIGIFFAVAMAVGIIFLSLKQQYTADAFIYLFGSILAVRDFDLWITAGITGISLGFLPMWRRWAYATFDSELARADGLPVEPDNYIFSILLAVTIVAAVKLVGILLIAAFLVLPPATARLVTTTFRSMTVFSVILGTSTAIGGLCISYALDIPSGPAIVLLQAALFFGILTVRGTD
jgi:zinc transport system permease protein